MVKIFPLILLFVGESLAIYAEVIAARNISNFSNTFWRAAILVTVGGLLLVLGYMLGIKQWQNIWIVGVVSITSIVIMEPIITYGVFQEIPTRGVLIGFILGILGLLSVVFIK